MQTATGADGEQAATGGAGWCLAPTVTTVSAGSCPAGHTYTASSTGAAGEVPATGGPGFCQPAAVSTTPAHTGSSIKHYTAVGGKSLAQIAAMLGTSPQSIVSDTSATDYNHGAAWPYLSDWNKPVPAGIILSYGDPLA